MHGPLPLWFDFHGLQRRVHLLVLFKGDEILLLLAIPVSSFSENGYETKRRTCPYQLGSLSIEPWCEEGYCKCCCASHKKAHYRMNLRWGCCTRCAWPPCVFQCLTPTPNVHPKDYFPNERAILFLPPIQTCPIDSTKTRHLKKKNIQTSTCSPPFVWWPCYHC